MRNTTHYNRTDSYLMKNTNVYSIVMHSDVITGKEKEVFKKFCRNFEEKMGLLAIEDYLDAFTAYFSFMYKPGYHKKSQLVCKVIISSLSSIQANAVLSTGKAFTDDDFTEVEEIMYKALENVKFDDEN